MPTKRNIAQLVSVTNQVIKKNNNEEISALKDNSLRQDFIVSFINWLSGGLEASSEIGYITGFTPTSPSAFPRLDMIKGTVDNPISEQYWKDAADVVWKVTMGTDGTFQFESI